MDLAFEAAGKFGKFQKMLILIVILLPMTILLLSAGNPLLIAKPNYFCLIKEEFFTEYNKCYLEDICKNLENFYFKKDDKNSIRSFTYEYDLICEKSYYTSLIGTLFFSGAIISCIFLATIPDKYGRLQIFKYLLLLNVLIHLNFLFSQNIYHILILYFLAGFNSYLTSIISLYISEVFDKKYSGFIMSLRSASFGLIGILITIFFMYVNNLKALFLLSSLLSLLIFLIVNKYFVESPRWLNSKNNMMEAIEQLKLISLINNTKSTFQKFLDLNNELFKESADQIEEIKKDYNIISILKFNSQRKNFLILAYIHFATVFCFFGLFANLDKKDGNIFFDSIITFTSEIVSELLSGICAGIFGRIIVMRTLSAFGGIAFIINYYTSHIMIKSICLSISSFGFSGTLCVLNILAAETFPTSIRAISITYLFLIGRFAAILLPIISTNFKYTPILIGILALGISILLGKLEETLGKEILDDMPEVVRKYSVLSINMSKLDQYLRQTIVNDSYFKMSFRNSLKISFRKSIK